MVGLLPDNRARSYRQRRGGERERSPRRYLFPLLVCLPLSHTSLPFLLLHSGPTTQFDLDSTARDKRQKPREKLTSDGALVELLLGIALALSDASLDFLGDVGGSEDGLGRDLSVLGVGLGDGEEDVRHG